MLILTCPYCGCDKDETELSAGGEAHLKRFGPGATDEEFEGYLFARANPKGLHFERWRCASGCGNGFMPPAAPPRWRSLEPIRPRRWSRLRT
jgi:sarcosine oxidase subunit delta